MDDEDPRRVPILANKAQRPLVGLKTLPGPRIILGIFGPTKVLSSQLKMGVPCAGDKGGKSVAFSIGVESNNSKFFKLFFPGDNSHELSSSFFATSR
jgi:hypothetical protein